MSSARIRNRRRNFSPNSGFSLIELGIVIGITGFSSGLVVRPSGPSERLVSCWANGPQGLGHDDERTGGEEGWICGGAGVDVAAAARMSGVERQVVSG